MLGRYKFSNTIDITNIKITGLANISNIALKVQCTVKCDTKVPGILRWKNHGGNCRVDLNWDPMIKSTVYHRLTSICLTTSRKRYPINRLECERPPTNSRKKNKKKHKSGNHLHGLAYNVTPGTTFVQACTKRPEPLF